MELFALEQEPLFKPFAWAAEAREELALIVLHSLRITLLFELALEVGNIQRVSAGWVKLHRIALDQQKRLRLRLSGSSAIQALAQLIKRLAKILFGDHFRFIWPEEGPQSRA